MLRQFLTVFLSLLFFILHASAQYRFHHSGITAGLVDAEVNGFEEQKNGDMVVSSNIGTFIYHGGTWNKTSAHPRTKLLKSICLPNGWKRESGKIIWKATSHSGILETVNGQIRMITRQEDDPYSLPTNHITGFYVDRKKNVWIGTSKGGVAVYNPYDLQYAIQSFPQNENLSCFIQGSNGSLWLGFDGQGIARVSSSGTEDLTFSTTNSGLTSDAITAVCYNRFNSQHEAPPASDYLFATFGGGIINIHESKILLPSWGKLPSVRYSRRMVFDCRGSLWVASVKGGVTCIDKQQWATVYDKGNSALETNAVTDICYDNSEDLLYIGTSTGLYTLELPKGTLRKAKVAEGDSIDRTSITTMTILPKGYVCLGTKEGIKIYQLLLGTKNQFRSIVSAGPQQQVGVVRAVNTDRYGSLWIATDDALIRILLKPGFPSILKSYVYHLNPLTRQSDFVKYALYRIGSDLLIGGFGQMYRITPVAPKFADQQYKVFQDMNLLETGPQKMHDKKLEWIFTVLVIIILAGTILVTRWRLLRRKKVKKQQENQSILSETIITDTMSPADKAFLAKAQQLISDHLSDIDYSIEQFAQDMLVSRSALYKKLMALTGLTPLAFLRKKRLERGRQLLQARETPVSSVAYQVGLSPKQFSHLFKETYGVLPSKYLHRE